MRPVLHVLSLLAIIPPVSAEDEVVSLDPYEVTESRFQESLTRVPSSVSIFGAADIATNAVTHITELLEDAGGISIRSATGNPTQASIDLRGFGEGGNQNVLILVDGLRINPPDMGSINWLDIPVHSISRIEVLRGSHTALYGNNAAGGVILIETAAPEASGLVLDTSVGSWDSYMARASAWTADNDLRVRIHTGYEESGGYRENSRYDSLNAGVTAHGRAGKWTWTTSGSANNTSQRFPGPLTESQYRRDPKFSIYGSLGSRYFSDTTRYTAAGAITGGNGELEASLETAASYRKRRWSQGQDIPAETELWTLSLDPSIRRKIGDHSTGTVGLDFSADLLDLWNPQDESLTFDQSLERTAAGIYALLQTAISDTVDTTFSGRVQARRLKAEGTYELDEINESKSGNDSAASAGVSWRISKSVRTWVRFDRFFRYPVTDEVAANPDYPLTRPFNADLEPEEGWSGEIATEYSAGPLRISLGAFWQEVEGMIAFDFIQNLNVNLADARRVGTEASITLHKGPWTAGVFHTAIDTDITSGRYAGKDIYLVPHQQVTARLEWEPSKQFRIRGSFRYQSDAWEGNDLMNQRSKLPAHGVLDLLFMAKVRENVSCYLGIENALDRKYAALKYNTTWYPANPISWRLGLRAEF